MEKVRESGGKRERWENGREIKKGKTKVALKNAL